MLLKQIHNTQAIMFIRNTYQKAALITVGDAESFKVSIGLDFGFTNPSVSSLHIPRNIRMVYINVLKKIRIVCYIFFFLRMEWFVTILKVTFTLIILIKIKI